MVSFFCYNLNGGVMEKILLVEDDLQIVKHLNSYLKDNGYHLISVDGQKKAMQILQQQFIDLILLDISLKEGNCFSLYNEIKAYYDIPIIFLTAQSDEFSIITGLDLGADDYISKPFQPRILLSRIQNILRRYKKKDQIFQYQNLKVYISQAKVYKNQQEIFLSALEYKLLLIFVQHAHHLLTREFLLEELYQDTGEDINDNTLTVYIKRLRNKIEDQPQHPQIIQTKRGLGYQLGD